MFGNGVSFDVNKSQDSPEQCDYERDHYYNNNELGYDENDDGLGLDGIGLDDIDICFWTEDLNIFTKDSEFKIVDGIGVGGFGVVVKVCDMSSANDIYAMKVIPKQKIIDNYEQQLRELNTMAKIENQCPFLQEIYGIYENESNVYIISEFLEGGDLFYHVTTHKFTQSQIKVILAELFIAIDYMHSQNIVHRDIKVLVYLSCSTCVYFFFHLVFFFPFFLCLFL